MAIPITALDVWARLSAVQWERWAGADVIARARATRLAELVRHAREHSRFYAERYGGLPEAPPLEALPVVTKHDLMSRFDDWVTDPEVTRERVAAFLADPR